MGLLLQEGLSGSGDSLRGLEAKYIEDRGA